MSWLQKPRAQWAGYSRCWYTTQTMPCNGIYADQARSPNLNHPWPFLGKYVTFDGWLEQNFINNISCPDCFGDSTGVANYNTNSYTARQMSDFLWVNGAKCLASGPETFWKPLLFMHSLAKIMRTDGGP